MQTPVADPRFFRPRFPFSRTRRETAGRALALFLVVVGARFWLVQRYSRALPFWDQWDGIGSRVLQPWLQGRLDWHAFWTPHNEHRIVLTRLLSWALVASNRQWDNLLETAVNAVLCGGTAVWLAGNLTAALGPAFRRRVPLAVALAFVLPFGWENTLLGFQSQNYFLILFSLLAISGLGEGGPGAGKWWLGALASGLACLSMASGFLAAATVLALRGGRLAARRRRPGGDDLVTGLWCFLVVAFGWFTRTEVPDHAVLRAESCGRFVVALGRFLAWPLCSWPVLGVLALVPLGALAVVYARCETGATPNPAAAGVERLLGFGGWALLQAAAMAYGRGGQSAVPASRYMDLLAVVTLVNFLAWQVLTARAWGTVWRGPTLAATALWLASLGGGLWTETVRDFTGWLPGYAHRLEQAETHLRDYVRTRDFNRFLAGQPADELPFPQAAFLAALVDDPALRATLPADVRAPLALEPLASTERGFVPGGFDPAVEGGSPGVRTWGSYPAGDRVFRARLAAGNALPYLRFAFCGTLGEPALRFALDGEPGSGAPSGWHPARPLPHGRWHEEDLRRPAGPVGFVLAEDHDPARWFAFSEPVEVGLWSRWAGFALRRGGVLAVVGVLLGLGLELGGLPGAWAAWRHRRRAVGVPPPPGVAGAGPLRLLSVVIPVRDEAAGIAATVAALHGELGRRGIPHEIVAVDDGSGDETWSVLRAQVEIIPVLRPVQNPGPPGFGRAVVCGLSHLRGDAVVIVMADASDDPADVVRYWEGLSEGYDCVFGSRFVPGSRVEGYPWLKRLVNRLANRFIQAMFRTDLNDTTNAFKAYRREVIDGCRPLVSLHFNLTVELPLKAMVRGFTWKVVPISWRNRRTGAAKFRLKEMGSRYLFICLSLWLEKHLSRGDYRRREADATQPTVTSPAGQTAAARKPLPDR